MQLYLLAFLKLSICKLKDDHQLILHSIQQHFLPVFRFIIKFHYFQGICCFSYLFYIWLWCSLKSERWSCWNNIPRITRSIFRLSNRNRDLFRNNIINTFFCHVLFVFLCKVNLFDICYFSPNKKKMQINWKTYKHMCIQSSHLLHYPPFAKISLIARISLPPSFDHKN